LAKGFYSFKTGHGLSAEIEIEISSRDETGHVREGGGMKEWANLSTMNTRSA
jgi:hypothetical protein